MRHRLKGRKLGRNGTHRKAMFRNMATSLINTLRIDEDAPNIPKVSGRIVTTVAKAKELRPFIEKLITLAKKARPHEEAAAQYATSEERNSSGYKAWRESDQWQQWANTIAPAVAMRRRAFAMLRDHEAVSILFDELSDRFADRPGGYTRIVQLAAVRLGDAGAQSIVEFVGENDRVQVKRSAPVVKSTPPEPSAAAPVVVQDDEEVAQNDVESPAAEDESTDTEDPKDE